MHVLYLMFNEGYTASSGNSLLRVDLSSEAVRLTRMLHSLLPDESEVAGLLALMLLTDARRAARTGPGGELIPLDEQDRSLWDQAAIEEGDALVTDCFRRGALGFYQLQAAIAAVHGRAARAQDTDWEDILGLHGLLLRMSDSAVVALNHAVALAMVKGPRAGLERLAALAADPALASGHRLLAVRGHLLEQDGQPAAAIECYLEAARRTGNKAERDSSWLRAARVRDHNGER